MLFGWDGLRFGFQYLAGVGDGEAGRKGQACRALDGWREQRGRARAEAFQEAAVRGLFRKGVDKEVPGTREADIEQPARLSASLIRATTPTFPSRSTSSTFLRLPKGQGQNRIQRPASGSWMENPFCTNAPHDSPAKTDLKH